MKNSYFDLIKQSYAFPSTGFEIKNNLLHFNGVDLQELIEKYGTPFRLTYLPKISENIQRAKSWFNQAIQSNNYQGKYHYCYCTKCCHFKHVINKALQEDIHLETSSSFDLDLIFHLFEKKEITNQITIVHNGYKTKDYLLKIKQLHDLGFNNSITILDSTSELERVSKIIQSPIKIGLRLATDLAPQSPYYTSRLGIRPSEIIRFYKNKIVDHPHLKLEMLHFFVDSGIEDSVYYWGEFQKAISIYMELKKVCPSLQSINIGGGFPIKNNLNFEYDYQYITNEIVRNIKAMCNSENIEEPDIYTEFGKYTVGESGAVIFSVLEQKQQNDTELWYIIDNSLINTIPDAWNILEKFILLPINKWANNYTRVNIGGISCDHSDYYNSEELNQQIFLPQYDSKETAPLYLGFFHTGAYQDAISGYGGIKHCLIPSPKHIIIDQNENGTITTELFRAEQKVEEMMKILGFTST